MPDRPKPGGTEPDRTDPGRTDSGRTDPGRTNPARPGSDLPEGMDYGALGHSLGFLLRLAQLRSFAAFYKDMGDLGIRPGEMTMLFVLSQNPGVRQGVLAKALRIKRAHMTKMVHGMEAEGLVTRTVPEDDKRSVELWLTDAGRARVEAVQPMFAQHETRPAGDLGRSDTEDLKRLLRRFLGMEKEPGQ